MSTGFQPFDSPLGGHVRLLTAELAAAQTFEAGDAVGIVTAQLTAIADATVALVGAFAGFAADSASGSTAATRTGLGRMQPVTEADFGATAGIGRSFVVPTADQTFSVRRFYTGTGSLAESDFDPNSATLGLWKPLQIAKPAGGEWGLLNIVGVPGTDVCAQVVGLYDEVGRRVLSTAAAITAAVRAGEADLVKPYRFIVRIANGHETQLGEAA